MRVPEFCIRVEFSQTDDEHTREYHVVLGGAQRGGLLVAHGYVPDFGPELLGALVTIGQKQAEMMEAYACTLNPLQLEFDLPH